MRALILAAAAVAAGLAILGTARAPETVKIVLVGDIMLSRNVAARIAGNPLRPFEGVAGLLDAGAVSRPAGHLTTEPQRTQRLHREEQGFLCAVSVSSVALW